MTAKQILELIKPHKDYKVQDYYGVSMIRHKSTGRYVLKLQHDYKNYSILSEGQLEISSLEKALEVYRILILNAKVLNSVNLDDLLSEDKEKKW